MLFYKKIYKGKSMELGAASWCWCYGKASNIKCWIGIWLRGVRCSVCDMFIVSAHFFLFISFIHNCCNIGCVATLHCKRYSSASVSYWSPERDILPFWGFLDVNVVWVLRDVSNSSWILCPNLRIGVSQLIKTKGSIFLCLKIGSSPGCFTTKACLCWFFCQSWPRVPNGWIIFDVTGGKILMLSFVMWVWKQKAMAHCGSNSQDYFVSVR